ncbi:MAG: hypothetical protein JSV59_11500 [Flavobacteriaceae bacterium]|nr:MAG: hypothetical protein JSV59_11500 [Flavobacteriaceae bacterium]
MQKWLTLLLFFCFLACSERISESDLNYINGYWEIQEVKFPNGKTKEYDINMTIDYFKFDKIQGFRKKMQPKFDGTFNTSSDAESFQIIEKDGSFWMHYKNDLSIWEEQIIKINKTSMVVKNKEGLSYHYRRFKTINIKE